MNYYIFIILNIFIFTGHSFPTFNIVNFDINETKVVKASHLITTVAVYNYPEEYFLRVFVESKIDILQSLVIIIKDDKSVVTSFELVRDSNQSVIRAARTICPFLQDSTVGLIRNRTLSIEFSSQSQSAINVSVTVRTINFLISVNDPRNLTITRNTPYYFLFKFQPTMKEVIVYVDSTDSECMILSIQESVCPIHDISGNVKFKGSYQSVTRSGAMVVQKKHYNSSNFVIVFTLNSNNYECFNKNLMQKLQKYPPIRKKYITFHVTEIIEDYLLPILGAIGFYLFFYLIFPIISFIYRFYCIKSSVSENVENSPIAHSDERPVSYETIEERADMKNMSYNDNQSYNIEVSSSVSGNQLAEDNEIIDSGFGVFVHSRLGNIFVSDLSKKNSALVDRKYFLYLWYVIIISVFYSLPVVQLVINYQRTLEVTGNQDICFYNFRCTRPLYVFIAFNNVMSNCGYVLLGILFTLITWRSTMFVDHVTFHYIFRPFISLLQARNHINNRHSLYNECKLRLCKKDYNLGIPQYYGLFYAMGVSLTMEGIMSACYHVCPSHDNFQFDTAYMYILASLCLIKIYQIRHPDIDATAHSFYMTMALFIFIGVIGVVFNRLILWIIFTMLYLFGLMFLSCEIYFLGQWNIDVKVPIQIYNRFKQDKWLILCPDHVVRMIIILIFNIVNISFALFGAIIKPSNFSSYFLAIFMINLLLYFFIYVILKIIYCESIYYLSILYVLIAMVCWGFALYCFIKHPTDWEQSPASSRAFNQNCLLLNFYDIHDIWHFLSSLSMFFSFMALLNIDDGLFAIERDKIIVF